MTSIPTVRIKSSHPEHVQGFIVINESDFDKEKHELWVDEAAARAVDKREAFTEALKSSQQTAEQAKRAEYLRAAQAIKAANPTVLSLNPAAARGRDDRNR